MASVDEAGEDWGEAAVRASNLAILLFARGDLREALEQARKSVDLADRSGDAFKRMAFRTTIGAIQHAMGLRDEAADRFELAEQMQQARQPDYRWLYSLGGFWYCDLLLDQGRDAAVRTRATHTLVWVDRAGPPLDVALDHISVGRAHLIGVQRGHGGDLAEVAPHLTEAVDGLRRQGRDDLLPLALLARAALFLHIRAFARAQSDLDEALGLATRGGLRLHEADAHLGLARLALARGRPHEARPHVDRAREIVAATGYHRRDGDLAELAGAVGGGAPAG